MEPPQDYGYDCSRLPKNLAKNLAMKHASQPCPACAGGYSRAYIHYLFKAREQTAMRLLTIHNLAFVQCLMAELRDAIDAGRLAEAAAAIRAGAAPWELAPA